MKQLSGKTKFGFKILLMEVIEYIQEKNEYPDNFQSLKALLALPPNNSEINTNRLQLLFYYVVHFYYL